MGGIIKCQSKLGEGTKIIFTVPVEIYRGDEGLSLDEEIKHQFEIAKLI